MGNGKSRSGQLNLQGALSGIPADMSHSVLQDLASKILEKNAK